MKKRMIAIAAATMATMMMATPVLAEDYKIGICNYVDDASLNQIVDNLESRLKEIGDEKGVNFDISYDNCNADANVMEQIISDFQADGVDLMVGVATPVAMRMQASTEGTDTPVVFSAVSDPVGAGLVESLEAPGANLTGTSDYLDTASIMKLIEAVNPDTKKIGLLYDIGQDSSTAAIEAAKAYMDENGNYGALGHGISDVDTGTLLNLSGGTLYHTDILSVVKGLKGSPGEMTGVIRYQSSEVLGTIEKNTTSGIFGRITKDQGIFQQGELVETAYKQDVTTGPAVLLSAVGGSVRAYSIQIEKVNLAGSDPNKSMVISVTDPELLNLTGGIIQGMSGSPILQNGKLIGAVTHVFVQDSARGYGIFIENMLSHRTA